MKELLITLFASIAGLLGLSFYERSKRKSAEAINDNVETKEELVKLDAQKQIDHGEEERKEIAKGLANENEPKSPEELAKLFNDFFNNGKPGNGGTP